MNPDKLRAWWSHRQGLDGRLASASPAEVFAETGWARSVAGVGPYLTLFTRAGIRRHQAETAVAALEIHELPTARGCTYVLPAEDFGLGLAAGAPFRENEMKTALKLGVTESEIGTLCEAVLKVVEGNILSPDEIRDSVGSAARSLGEEGKKKGLTTTLPLALGKLQAAGEIRRVPIEGRLDQQRYKYTCWIPNPRAGLSLTQDEIQVELARRFFKWIGPATLAEFQWFSGLGVGAAKKALSELRLQEVEPGSGRWILSDYIDEFTAFQMPSEPTYHLVSSLDTISLLRRDLKSLLTEEDLGRSVFYGKDYTKLEGLADLPNHGIIDRGRLVGLWEYDTFSASIVWISFDGKNEALLSAVASTECLVRDELGDARSFSLDSPKSRIPAIEALRRG